MQTETIITAITGAITTIGGMFLTHRKTKKDLQKSELQNVEQAITIWREMAESLKTDVVLLKEHNQACEKKNAELEKLILTTQNEVTTLKLEIERMKH